MTSMSMIKLTTRWVILAFTSLHQLFRARAATVLGVELNLTTTLLAGRTTGLRTRRPLRPGCHLREGMNLDDWVVLRKSATLTTQSTTGLWSLMAPDDIE